MRFLFVTMDNNHDAALHEAARMLQREHGIEMELGLYNATTFQSEAAWQRLADDVQAADFIFGCMIFKDEMVRPMQELFRVAPCSVCVITSSPSMIRTTRLGKFSMDMGGGEEGESSGVMTRLMKRLRPKKGQGETTRQVNLLRNLAKIMRYIPGKARDLHTFIAAHDYWLQSTPDNLYRFMCLLIERYVPGYAGKIPVQDPIRYPDTAIYHPDAATPFADLDAYRKWRSANGNGVATTNGDAVGAVGLLAFRAAILSGNTAHLDALIRAIEAHGIEARAAFAVGLDSRPAIDEFFTHGHDQTPGQAPRHTASGHTVSGNGAGRNGSPATVDLLLNGMGFSLVGGPAQARPEQAQAALDNLDVGYMNMIPLSFQRVEDWRGNEVGLTPIQTAMNIAIPELDGVIEPLIYGGATAGDDQYVAIDAQIDLAAARIARHVRLRRKSNADKKIAVVLFNFPPNMGNAGTAAYLDVFASLHRMLGELQAAGYQVDLPPDAETLRKQVVEGNAVRYGTAGNVGGRLSVTDYRRLFPAHREIEEHWGLAPGELLNDGKSFYILGAYLGNVFVGIQPSFGYEGDPMRLLMGKGMAPHHGFAAFYTWLEHLYDADAVVHFGTHGALEFMPGKQIGLTVDCWPSRLLGSLPNYYYYSVNNPSEGSIAKRRGAATLVSYMVPPLQQAGLYKGLRLLKDSVETYHRRPSPELLDDIRTQVEKLGIVVEAGGGATGVNGTVKGNGVVNGHGSNGTADGAAADSTDAAAYLAALGHELIQVEHRMIPMGLHVLGKPPSDTELVDILTLVAAFNPARHPDRDEKLPVLPALIAQGKGWDYRSLQETLKHDPVAQDRWEEIDAIAHQAMSHFVDAPRQPALDTSAADAYLQEAANIPAGLLANLWSSLDDLLGRILQEHELQNLVRGLSGGYVPPSPGNDVVRNAGVVPTGRNLHALDPYRVPTPAAAEAAQVLVRNMLERLVREQGGLPETVAMILWGTDNLKSECEGVAQVFHLLGVRAVQDELGNVADVELIPLEELGRPRIDVVMTVSGIFRDLLDHQLDLLDRAVRLAANAPEPPEQNFVRKHAQSQAQELSISVDQAATRVFCNAPGAYGANINHLIESSTWENEQEITDTFLSRKSFAYMPGGQWQNARDILERSFATVDATFQNIDSFELGISDVDHYYEYLGGVAKSVEKLSGKKPPVLVADAISQTDRLASLEQMVRLESRAKLLNPKWYEAMMEHGYEGVREIETRVGNTYGWSVTAEAVEGWVYNDIASTFLLDEELRERMAQANPHATAAIARRLLEADGRGFWDADEDLVEKLREIYGDLEDRMEGL